MLIDNVAVQDISPFSPPLEIRAPVNGLVVMSHQEMIKSGREPQNHVPVTFGFELSKYRSFKDAVTGDFDGESIDAIQGMILEEFIFDGEQLLLRLSGGLCLLLGCSETGVKWSIEEHPMAVKARLPKETSFILPDGSVVEWQVEQTLVSLIGERLKFSPSEQFFFIRTRYDEFTISFLRHRDENNKRFLTMF